MCFKARDKDMDCRHKQHSEPDEKSKNAQVLTHSNQTGLPKCPFSMPLPVMQKTLIRYRSRELSSNHLKSERHVNSKLHAANPRAALRSNPERNHHPPRAFRFHHRLKKRRLVGTVLAFLFVNALRHYDAFMDGMNKKNDMARGKGAAEPSSRPSSAMPFL